MGLAAHGAESLRGQGAGRCRGSPGASLPVASRRRPSGPCVGKAFLRYSADEGTPNFLENFFQTFFK